MLATTSKIWVRSTDSTVMIGIMTFAPLKMSLIGRLRGGAHTGPTETHNTSIMLIIHLLLLLLPTTQIKLETEMREGVLGTVPTAKLG